MAENHLEEFDWFVKIDHDAVFIPENLEFIVNEQKWNPNDLLYFGHTIFEQSRDLKNPNAQFNVGAGYGVSRALLKAIYPYLPNATYSSIPENERCKPWVRWGEDYKFADCLRVLFPDLLPIKTLDSSNRETFLPFELEHHLILSKRSHVDTLNWFFRGKPFEAYKDMTQCCSSRPTVFHQLKMPFMIRVTEYFLYDVAIDPQPCD